MTTTIDAIDASVVPLMALAYADASALIDRALAEKPNTIVLQPSESLNYTNSREFQYLLEEALENAAEAVIVDLIWVDSTDAHGIAALVAGIQYAAAFGKFLSFQSMNADSQLALEAAWAYQQESNAGAWSETFSADLESFLDGFTHR